MKVHKGDQVLVTGGKDRGKRGQVERVLPKDSKVVVSGVNLVTRHVKARPGVRQVGRVRQEMPVDASKVMLICNRCNRPVRTRMQHLEDGRKVRVCLKCQETIDWGQSDRE